MCRILTRILNLEGYHVITFTDPVAALRAIEREPPDVVLTDIRMPTLSGEEVLKRVQELDSEIAVIILTAYGTIQGAVDSLKRGAYDYITKPFQMDDILLTVGRAMENRRLRQENRLLSDTLGRATVASTEMIGESPEIQEIRRLIEKIAPSDSAVLITGESGTGKALVARAVHRLSHRSAGRFVPINCASIPENLLESELFGYERGAFTGAARTKLGLMELAGGGTLFLDEIGDMSAGLQAKLLRSLQEREIQRVGGLRSIPIDIRLVAATNRDLKRGIENGAFRRDLFYRLNVISIELPPLRRRRGDIPVLARHFLKRLSDRRRREITITDAALARLQEHSWPGNVRELENILERTVVLLDGNVIDAADLPSDLSLEASPTAMTAGGRPITPPPHSVLPGTVGGTPPGAGAPGAAGTFAEPGAASDGAGVFDAADLEEEMPPSAPDTGPESLARAARHLAGAATDFREARDRFEREYLVEILRRSSGSVAEAARRTGMSRRNLYEKIEKLEIPLDQIKENEQVEPPSSSPTNGQKDSEL